MQPRSALCYLVQVNESTPDIQNKSPINKTSIQGCHEDSSSTEGTEVLSIRLSASPDALPSFCFHPDD